MAFTFCVGKEIYKLRDIMRYTKTKIQQQKLPTLSDVEEMKTNIYLEKIKGIIEEGHLTKYIHLVDRLMEEDYTSIDIAAALLKDHLSDVNADDIDALDDINLGGTELYGGEGEKMVRLFINAGKKAKSARRISWVRLRMRQVFRGKHWVKLPFLMNTPLWMCQTNLSEIFCMA